jgi:hypothetical protein
LTSTWPVALQITVTVSARLPLVTVRTWFE